MGKGDVYVKAQFIDALDAVKTLKKNSPKSTIPPELTVRKIYDFLKKHPINAGESYINIAGAYALGKTEGDKTWKMHTISAGGSSTVVNSSEAATVTKLYRKTEKDYRSAQSRTSKILDKVNPNNDAIGLQRSPIFTEQVKEISVYNLGTRIVETIKGFIFIEVAYKSDCLNGKYQKTELPSMVACLIQGSKNLLEHEVYHLDVKPENIGYLGNGKVEHFDLDGSILGDESLKDSLGTMTDKYTCRQDLKDVEGLEKNNVKNLTAESKKILEKMHIFLLGASICAMATGKMPYVLEKHDDPIDKQTGKKKPTYPLAALEEGVLKGKLETCGAGFSDDQIGILIKMVSLNRDGRPTIAEIEAVFPEGLIQGK